MRDYGAAGAVPSSSLEETENILEAEPTNDRDEQTQQEILHHSSSFGEEKPDTNNKKTSSREHHHHTNSWSGVLSSYATGIFGGDNSHSNINNQTRHPTGPPPKPPARRHTVERDYHLKNQKFLQKAAAQKAAREQRKQPYASPSPTTKFRKRLKAIEEDGQQSLVLIDGSRDSSLEAESSTASSKHLPRFYDSDELTTINWQENDESSVISSLAGSMGGMDYFHRTNSNNSNNSDNDSNDNMPPMMMSEAEVQRLAKFEQQQEAQFQVRKQEMEARLSKALDTSPIKGEEDRKEFVQAYMQQLELERAALMAQWKNDMMREHVQLRHQDSLQRLLDDFYDALIKPCVDCLWSILTNTEVVLSNMPLTIGAVGLSWVTMGVVWFKFMEEMVDTCHHVWYFSGQCSFREFPGCFACDVENPWYKAALTFHYICSTVSGIACLLFLFKVILAPNVVWDMLKNPTTSTPVGVWCIAMVCTFAGQRGFLGEMIVLVTVYFHVVLAFWFLYMCFFQFRLWAEPGWFPCIVGISYAGIKTWIYFPVAGLLLVALCTIFFFATFFISVVRVYLNHKISAPVCWIQLSAPSITLYALTLISQPTQQEEALFESSPEAKAQYDVFLTTYYLPTQHIFMALTIVGLASAVHGLWVRWPTFKSKPFSPAHIAFCFPTLSHTNAIQAYRASVNALSSLPPDSLFKKVLFCYWCFFLVAGTLLNIIFTIKYVIRIPEWTRVDTTGEVEPPPPSQTAVQGMLEDMDTHESLKQSFVSPAVLEANEAGVLVRIRRDTDAYRYHGPFVRTRKVSSLGFDPTMDFSELQEERARLLDWAANNAPRRRHRTMSDFLQRLFSADVGGFAFGSGGSSGDMYGTFQEDQTNINTPIARAHTRSQTDV